MDIYGKLKGVRTAENRRIILSQISAGAMYELTRLKPVLNLA